MRQLFSSLILACIFFAVVPNTSHCGVLIPPLSAHAFPNEDIFRPEWYPSNAIDGLLNTAAAPTRAFNTDDSCLALKLDGLQTINRIRLYKDAESGSPGFGKRPKDLKIQYTNDTTTDMSLRNWFNVTGLSNGYLGREFLNATAVNSNGTVLGDFHDSPTGDGWASLVFDPVQATGVRVFFSKPVNEPYVFMHYIVYEFEVYGPPRSPVPEPSTMAIFGLGALGMAYRARRKTKA